ncbi:sushi, nidogen and EGF-like domain-containing protein 1 [Lithobates pipiens]
MRNICIIFLFFHTDGLLYPYGPSIDNVTPKSDDGVSPPIPFTVPYFGENYSSIYVNNNGLLSFDVELGNSSVLHLTNATVGPFLAPFWADINNEILGEVYYRLSNDSELLNLTRNDISSYFPGVSFSPKWVLVATWDKVSYNHNQTNKTNTFQTVLSTDENSTFIMFNYGDIQWPTGKENEGPPALAGGSGGFTELKFEIPGSLTADIINITHTSNVNFPGRWVFRVDQVKVLLQQW